MPKGIPNSDHPRKTPRSIRRSLASTNQSNVEQALALMAQSQALVNEALNLIINR